MFFLKKLWKLNNRNKDGPWIGSLLCFCHMWYLLTHKRYYFCHIRYSFYYIRYFLYHIRYLNTDELSLSECACTSEMQVKFAEVQACLENIGFSTKVSSFYFWDKESFIYWNVCIIIIKLWSTLLTTLSIYFFTILGNPKFLFCVSGNHMFGRYWFLCW